MTNVEKKARRRIKRQLKTGVRQHRVVQIDETTFRYDVKHGVETMRFKLGKLNRLRKVSR